ncbi:hypothetical protein Tco_1182214 [Tanacetum coccineum]
MIKSSAEKILGAQEDASKWGKNEIDQDEGISWFQEDAETHGRYGYDVEINTASTSTTTASINITTVEPVTTASAPITTAGVSVSTAKPSTPPTTTILMKKSEKLGGEKDLTIAQTLMKMRSVKSKENSKEKGVSKADYELAQRLQAEEQRELTIEERSKLFVELMDKRKKHFANLRAEEIRRKPPTKAQKRNQMYLFVPMDSEVVKGSKIQAEGSKKRTRKELDEESVKRQKLEDDAEKAELKACLEIVPDDDSAVNV